MHAPAAPAGVGSAAPPARVCAQCGAEGIWQCVKCKKAVYCSRKCQKRHWWANHKGRCFAPEERKAFNTPANRWQLSMAAFQGDVHSKSLSPYFTGLAEVTAGDHKSF